MRTLTRTRLRCGGRMPGTPSPWSSAGSRPETYPSSRNPGPNAASRSDAAKVAGVPGLIVVDVFQSFPFFQLVLKFKCEKSSRSSLPALAPSPRRTRTRSGIRFLCRSPRPPMVNRGGQGLSTCIHSFGQGGQSVFSKNNKFIRGLFNARIRIKVNFGLTTPDHPCIMLISLTISGQGSKALWLTTPDQPLTTSGVKSTWSAQKGPGDFSHG